jgi:hypothetical protein
MTIDSGGLDSSRLFTGGALSLREQKFALDFEQARFDRTGATKSPQQVCQPMNERKLDHWSRINTADEGTLERSVGSNIFETLNDGLVSKPIAPGVAAWSVAFAVRINTGQVRDILLHWFVRSPHRHPRAAALAPLAWKIR